MQGRIELRLAVVSPFLDRRHGTERALSEAVERLARDYPCEVHLFAQHVEDLDAGLPGDVKTIGASSIVWHRVPSVAGPHLLQFVFWYFRNRAVRRAVSRDRGVAFDLVLSPGINCGDADVVIVHALFQRLRELSAESSATRGLQKWHQAAYYQVMARLETRIYRNPAVHLAAVSPRTKADLQRYFARGDVTVIPNAVDSAAFSPSARLARRGEMRSRWALDEEEFVLLLIGNDWRVKGLPTILEAMALLSDLPLRLLVAGSDAAEPFRDLARELGVLQRCIWEPAAGNVLGFYAAADVYVSPSLEDSFALPVAESMACGLPAITSVNAGISAYLTDGVDALVLTDPRDARALAERLRELHDKPDLIQDMGDAGARKALEWTWERNAAQIWDLLQTALRNK